MTQQHDDFDAVIIGGGAIGGMQALALAEQGYRVAIVEMNPANTSPSNPERVIALSYGSHCLMQSLGIWEPLAARGSGAIRYIDVQEPDGHGMMHMSAREKQVDALGYVVDLGHVVEVVNTALDGKVTHFCPATVTAWESDAEQVRVSVKHEGQVKTITARLLIAADGTNSQIRRMAGIPTQGWEHNRFALVTSVRCERDHADTAYECFRSSGPLAFLPLADGRFSIVWALAPQEAMRLLNMPERMFLNRLQRAAGEAVLPRSGRMLGINRRVCFPLELRIARSYAAPRMLLMGNAAHTLHPVAGQGLNLGIRDIQVWMGLCQDKPSDLGAPLMVKAYAEQRRLDVLAVAGFTESMLEAFAHDIPPLRWVRGKALDAMQFISPLRHALMEHAAGLTQVREST